METPMSWDQQEVFRLLKAQPGTMYQEADETGRKYFRDWVRSFLEVSETTLTFVKADGTVRDMRCTLDSSRIPPKPPVPYTVIMTEEIQDSSTVNIDGLAKSQKPRKEPDPVTQRVYDLDQGAWRSFRYDRLKKITTEINFTK